MGEMFTSMLMLLMPVFGLAPGAELPMLGLAMIVLAAAALAVGAAVILPDAGQDSPPRPERGIDVSALLAQSDPDADGHPRPRAPQVAAAA